MHANYRVFFLTFINFIHSTPPAHNYMHEKLPSEASLDYGLNLVSTRIPFFFFNGVVFFFLCHSTVSFSSTS